ncbi:hypothetical protein AQS8620_01296 [Aquimixticola soesokkakensis]|uniref:Uncharacterized protein n=2 Tax=Aquimixticola soesokkakensis TaxID=1519096 RepID=A0A1Y5SBZ5_9RHOB|nr:hypothetical protein AQS8620_01296 [Aquimixticola soesokkakensis]
MRVASIEWDIDWRGQSAGSANDGSSQLVYNRFPRWVGAATLTLHGDAARQWRAIKASAQGRVNIYRVPMFDPLNGGPATPTEFRPSGVPFSTEENFSNGLGFEYAPFVRVVTGCAAGAAEIHVEEVSGPVRVGSHLSINDWPFIVTWRDENGDGTVILGVTLLRVTLAVGDQIEMRAHGLFAADSDDMGRMPYGGSRAYAPALNFTEYLNR